MLPPSFCPRRLLTEVQKVQVRRIEEFVGRWRRLEVMGLGCGKKGDELFRFMQTMQMHGRVIHPITAVYGTHHVTAIGAPNTSIFFRAADLMTT